MASPPLDDDDPPPYVVGNHNDAGEILQPVILVLTGHFIRAQTVDGTPLYELSRDIRTSSTSEAQLAQVSLERLIHNVRAHIRAEAFAASHIYRISLLLGRNVAARPGEPGAKVSLIPAVIL
ncbi:hypothetical protein ABKA04_003353 [Annulohypoxylon sp. FPYF3050]